MKIIARVNNGHDVWNVNAKCKRIAKPIARRLGMTIEELLTRLSRNELMAHLSATEDPLDEPTSAPAGFTCPPFQDQEISFRLQRAAKFEGQSIELFAWKAIASSIVCSEEGMIIDSKTHEAVGDAMELEQFRESVYRKAVDDKRRER